MKKFTFGRRSKKLLYGDKTQPPVKVTTQKLAERALRETTTDFSVIDGFRTAAKQNKLFKRKRTTLDGYRRKSAHQSGNAIDIIPVVKDPTTGRKLNPFKIQNIYVRDAWFEVGRAFLRAGFKLKLKVEWGIAYDIHGGRDYPHFQIRYK